MSELPRNKCGGETKGGAEGGRQKWVLVDKGSRGAGESEKGRRRQEEDGGEGSGWVGGIGREEERNESDMMLLALCDITEAKKNTEHINSYRIWCMIR